MAELKSLATSIKTQSYANRKTSRQSSQMGGRYIHSNLHNIYNLNRNGGNKMELLIICVVIFICAIFSKQIKPITPFCDADEEDDWYKR